MKTKKRCYMCTAEKSSVEHVPPRCLFPEKKDLPNSMDLRKQLITVPSCDVHNTHKSKDDEYLLYVLLINIPNNETAENHFFKKVMRAIERNPSLINQFAKKQVPITAVDTVTGKIHRTVAVQINEQRLHNSLKSIGYALYFHHFGKRWEGSIAVHPHFLLHVTKENAEELNKPNEDMERCVELLMANAKKYGENPDVFCYQVSKGNDGAGLIMLLRIYEGSRITLIFKK